ncbi:hypothetical protein BDN70DRAFT_877698 [Pholiota conissans]|uniref:Uncharacterized protein n=1 Tax=Pholiota conissans TaxID=109636 RepID=A0A9P5Z452_9AGAR|nr:hypothetical protein BDN70DRAFT_877698 [Pholiota conissans]
MKFLSYSLAVCLAFSSVALATPAPQVTDPLPVYHCGGLSGSKCPTGWRCCGPIQVDVGGTCYQGTTGICPL